MTASIHASRFPHAIPLAPAAGLLLLALAVAFMAGRATVLPGGASPVEVQAPAAATQPAEPPPWATQGFRDDETSVETCSAPECNG